MHMYIIQYLGLEPSHEETMATIVSGLPFFDLAQCRPASKGMLSVSHDCYWRCREMSLPLDPSVLGGFRRNRAGRSTSRDLLGCVGMWTGMCWLKG